MTKNNIVTLSAKFVRDLFKKNLPVWAIYHSPKHTSNVVAECIKIGRAIGLDNEDIEILEVAGWFHDTGYTIKVKNNERHGAAIAKAFLIRNNYHPSKIRKVISCIMATKMPQRPRNILEKSICDADLASVAKKTFLEENELLRKEIMKCKDINLNESTWLRRTETFLRNHKFYTTYGKTVLERGRKRNLAVVKQLLRNRKERADRILKKNNSSANTRKRKKS